jgi:hypothetical protein
MIIKRSIKTPRTRWVLFPSIIFLIGIDSLVLFYYPPFWGVLLGLLIDIFGATILAVPDIPAIWHQTFSGRLNYAKETVDRTGRGGFSTLCRSGSAPTQKETETGFPELLEVITPLIQDGLSDHTHGLYFVKDGWDADDINRIEVGSSLDIALFEELPETELTGYKGWTTGPGVPDTAAFFYPKNLTDKEINRQIEKYTTRIRRLGLAVLVTGFAQQFVFLVLENYS